MRAILAHSAVISQHEAMGLVIAVVGGSALLIAVGVWAWVSREGPGTERDLGTISGQWINERRAQERQPDNR
jgi:hypothetical protein